MTTLNCELSKGIEERRRALIRAAATRRKYPANAMVVRAREPVHSLFVLTRGTARLFLPANGAKEIVIARLAPGDVFGLRAFLKQPGDYLGTVETTAECEFAQWSLKVARRMAEENPELMANALAIAVSYLGRFARRHANLLTRSASERIADVLLQMASRAEKLDTTGIELNVTNEELASLADVSPYTISRTLSLLEQQGVLEKTRERVLIRSPEDLAKTRNIIDHLFALQQRRPSG